MLNCLDQPLNSLITGAIHQIDATIEAYLMNIGWIEPQGKIMAQKMSCLFSAI